MEKILHILIWLFKKITSFIIRNDDNNDNNPDLPPENGDGNIADILVDYELEPEKIDPSPKQFKKSAKSKRVGKLSFKNPHPNLEQLQLKAARAILSFVGGHYLPLRLKSLLKYYDAFFAVNGFLAEMMGLSYRILLTDNSERELLEECLGRVLQADLILRDSKLDDLPIYKAIKSRNFELADSYIIILEAVSPAIQELQNSTITFQGDFFYRKKEAEKLLKNWHTLDEKQIKQIVAWHTYWTGLQKKYDFWLAEVATRVNWIQTHFPQETVEQFNTVILAEINECLNAGTAGTIDIIEEVIGKLQDYVEQLESLIQEFKAKQNDFQEPQQEKTTQEEKQYEPWEWRDDVTENEQWTRAYCIFEFETPYPQYKPTEKEFSKRYRKLALKYHSDINPKKIDEEKMKSLNRAKDFLENKFKYGKYKKL